MSTRGQGQILLGLTRYLFEWQDWLSFGDPADRGCRSLRSGKVLPDVRAFSSRISPAPYRRKPFEPAHFRNMAPRLLGTRDREGLSEDRLLAAPLIPAAGGAYALRR